MCGPLLTLMSNLCEVLLETAVEEQFASPNAKVVESGFWFCTVVGTYVMNVSLKKEMVRREPVLVGVLVFVKRKISYD